MKTPEEINYAIKELERQIEFCRNTAATYITNAEHTNSDMYRFWIGVSMDYQQRLIALEWVCGIHNDGIA